MKVVGAKRIPGKTESCKVDGVELVSGDGIRIEFEGRPGGGIYKVVHNETEETMKQFSNQSLAELHSAEGNAALYVYDKDRRGILFDKNRTRLQHILTRSGLGIQYIHIRHDGKPNQSVDVSGSVLGKLIAGCEPAKTKRKTAKVKKTGALGPSEAMGGALTLSADDAPDPLDGDALTVDGDDTGGDDD